MSDDSLVSHDGGPLTYLEEPDELDLFQNDASDPHLVRFRSRCFVTGLRVRQVLGLAVAGSLEGSLSIMEQLRFLRRYGQLGSCRKVKEE